MKKLLLICTSLAVLKGYESKAQVIDSIKVTESRCVNSGSATIYFSGGSPPITYTLQSGPGVTSPLVQSGNTFNALLPGTYNVSVAYNTGSVSSSFTIAGSYTTPNPTAIFTKTSCPSATDASITITPNGGLAPYQYSLISPITTSWQTSNIFTNLAPGIYSYQVTDSCGNLQTRSVSIPSTQDAVSIQYLDIDRFSCDSAFIVLRIYPTSTLDSMIYPFTATYKLPNGDSVSKVINNGVDIYNAYVDTIRYAYSRGVDADSITVKYVNNCGRQFSMKIGLDYYDFSDYAVKLKSCDAVSIGVRLYTLLSDVGSPWGSGLFYNPEIYSDSVKFYLIDNTAGGTTVDSIIRSTVLTSEGRVYFENGTPGHNYSVLRVDPCGIIDTLNLTWPAMPDINFQIYSHKVQSCVQNTTDILAGVTYGLPPYTLIINSGADSLVRLDGTVHYYTYPDTIFSNFSSFNGYIGGFATGTYSFTFYDSCGRTDTGSFTVGLNDVRVAGQDIQVKANCDNSTVIRTISDFQNNDVWPSWATLKVSPTIPNGNKSYIIVPEGSVFIDTLINVSPGTYTFVTNLMGHGGTNYGLNGIGLSVPSLCDSIVEQVVINNYTTPVVENFALSLCGSNANTAIIINPTTGAPPYRYRINSGPGISSPTAYQSTNVFTVPTGMYQFEAIDTCFNSYQVNYFIDSLLVPTPITMGSTCIGDTAYFVVPSNPYYTYSWTLLDGSTVAGDTLIIPDIDSSKYGDYTIKVVSNIDGCSDSSSKVFRLDSCAALPLYITNLNIKEKDCLPSISADLLKNDALKMLQVMKSNNGINWTIVYEEAYQGQQKITYTDINNNFDKVTFYKLVLVNYDGSDHNSSALQYNSSCNTTSSIKVYPTKTNGIVNIDASLLNTNPAAIMVINNDGKIVYSNNQLLSNQISIDLSSLSNGLYYIGIVVDNKLKSYKVILSK